MSPGRLSGSKVVPYADACCLPFPCYWSFSSISGGMSHSPHRAAGGSAEEQGVCSLQTHSHLTAAHAHAKRCVCVYISVCMHVRCSIALRLDIPSLELRLKVNRGSLNSTLLTNHFESLAR